MEDRQVEIRFGTSGFRGRWGFEFTEDRVKWVTQAICDDLATLNLQGRVLVIGYDSRLHADQVARWCAEVAVANKFKVYLTSRDTPTPALIYVGIETSGVSHIAGFINCTASHNPVEWHGIKFSLSSGCPAPTDVTARIESLANQYQQRSMRIESVDLDSGTVRDKLQWIDPLETYCDWILQSGESDNRIKLNHTRIKQYFDGKLVIIDEMHGTGRGYLRRILDKISVSYEVLHGERDPTLGELHAANPEEPYIESLKSQVATTGAALGIGLDTDADRYGAVDAGGQYFTPNQILAMLVHYLGVERKLAGKIAVSHVTSRLIDDIAGHIPAETLSQPGRNVVPSYLTQPEYEIAVGNVELFSSKNVFTVPVGLKYIVEVPQLDENYERLKIIPDNWRDLLLIGGEESSGLTTKGHVPDKDGIWAGLLIMDMMAFYQKPLKDIWTHITQQHWNSHTLRLNLDVPDEAKAKFINFFFENYETKSHPQLGSFDVIYIGGIRGKLIEMRMRDSAGNMNYYLQSRPSGTEPLIRVYIEAEGARAAREIEQQVKQILRSVLTG